MPDPRARRNPEQRAAEFLKQHLADVATAPVPVERLAALSGAVVVEAELDEDLAGMLVRDGNRKVIAIAAGHAEVRQRFTIAHELGHLLMHPGRPLIAESAHAIRVDRRKNTVGLADQREEREANQFAAALLMPQSMTIAEWDRIGGGAVTAEKVRALAAKFIVSAQAMHYRLINLGLLMPNED